MKIRLPLLACLALAGCATVGPDYVLPPTPTPAAWQSVGPSTVADATNPEDLTRWWQSLGDPVLDGLIRDALAASPDLASARAKLREARARRDLAGAQRFPTLGAGASATRASTSRSAASGSSAARDLYSAGFDAAWEPDVFGGQARALEAARADLQASTASLAHTQVSVVAEVALNYVELRSAQARLAIARANLASQSETLQLTEWRAQAGLVGSLDVDQARSNREQTRAQIPALETSAAEARHRLAILLGQAPGALAERLAAAAPIPRVPERVAVGIPAQTLAQRPDVAVAERNLAAATARVGVAEAARYPGFQLTGSIGSEALSLGALGGGATLARSLAASVAATLFDAGRLARQVDIQDAQREQALVSYRQAVLTALEDVENALVALANTQHREEALASAETAARSAADLARQRYASGLVDFQTVLDTERSLLTVQDGLASASAERATALVQLYKALGGGWTPEPDNKEQAS
jgi:outer membrane protein, multidrug efflux system